MSTFAGKMTEIPEISIDCFEGDNTQSEAFFLSHCHTDHMHGLQHENVRNGIVSNDRFLYLSHISADIIKFTHPTLANNLRQLDMYTPTVIVLKDKTIEVTPIPAGHCPGSVMFLFECDKTVLYTGDFRINPRDVHKIKAFYNSLGVLKRIDAIYLDTTFFFKDYATFPGRTESLDTICKLVSDWIVINDKHVIELETQAKYGYEYVFLEIYKKFKMPIHVNKDIYDFYRRVPELDQAVTLKGTSTQIHCACGSYYKFICRNQSEHKIRTIKLSAMRWNSDKLQSGICEDGNGRHLVCYSTHASYEEIVALVKFLRPKKIEPNVLVRDRKDEIYENIHELLEEGDYSVPKKVKLFDLHAHKSELVEAGTSVESCSEGSNSYIQNILDSPPRRFAT